MDNVLYRMLIGALSAFVICLFAFLIRSIPKIAKRIKTRKQKSALPKQKNAVDLKKENRRVKRKAPLVSPVAKKSASSRFVATEGNIPLEETTHMIHKKRKNSRSYGKTPVILFIVCLLLLGSTAVLTVCFMNAKSALAEQAVKISALSGEVSSLTSDLSSRDAEIAGLKETVDGKDRRIKALEDTRDALSDSLKEASEKEWEEFERSLRNN